MVKVLEWLKLVFTCVVFTNYSHLCIVLRKPKTEVQKLKEYVSFTWIWVLTSQGIINSKAIVSSWKFQCCITIKIWSKRVVDKKRIWSKYEQNFIKMYTLITAIIRTVLLKYTLITMS